MAASDVQLTALEGKVDALTVSVNRLVNLHAKDHDELVKLVERVETACHEIDKIRNAQIGDNSVAWARVWQIATVALSAVAGLIGGALLWVIKAGRVVE